MGLRIFVLENIFGKFTTNRYATVNDSFYANNKTEWSLKEVRMTNDEIFKKIQVYLENPPLIIWGSGATIGFGLPSMSRLKDEIGKFIPTFDVTCSDLETELGKEKYEGSLPRIRKVIRDVVLNADLNAKENLIRNVDEFEGIRRLTDFCFTPHPKKMDVVTTNYDRILEYVWGFFGYSFSDGFKNHELSIFDKTCFNRRGSINLMKVHGSLDWLDVNGDVRKISGIGLGYDPVMIPPGKNKYKTALNSPYREIMQQSDDSIREARSFLVIGFGFNDEHITPLVTKKAKDGIPIIVVTKQVTSTTKVQLREAKKVIFIEAGEDESKSRIRIIEKGVVMCDNMAEDRYWMLNKFMDIIYD